MIDKFADTDAVDENGWTALHYAAYKGYPDCVKVLLLNAADRSLRDNKHRRPLDLARYRHKLFIENPAITKAEMFARHNVNHGNCIALLEDLKSRLTDLEDEGL